MEKSQALNTQEIKQRSFLGVLTLTSRTFTLQIIALVATFILTILLDPSTFGIFFVVTAAVNFLNYFSDIGLAAALIQKKEEPTEKELKTTFTIQQSLVGIAVLIALLLSGRIATFYGLGSAGLFLFRALVFSFMLSSLKTIPTVLLERKLDFKKLVIPQIAETLAFYIVAVTLAFMQWGVVSFAWAALIRGVVGTVVLYIIAGWRIGVAFDISSAKRLLTFGVPYQANSFMALIKDDLLTIFLGKIMPFTAIGYIGWAKKWAEISLRLIMDNVIKVTFPAYSRLQHDRELLSKAIHKSFLFLALFSLPIAVGMIFMVKPLIAIIPRYSKWEPALFSFYLFTFSSVLATLSSPLVNALNALGKVRYTFYLMIMWTLLTWLLVPAFVYVSGYNGVAVASVIIGFTSFIPLIIFRRIIPIRIFREIRYPLFSSVIMALDLGVITVLVPTSSMKLFLGIVSGGIVYGSIIYLFMAKELLPYLAMIRPKNRG